VNGTTTTTKYYGKSAVNANGTLAYLLDDGLGSVSENLSATGSVQGAQLFAPYGSVRYSTGSFPGPQAFTGQRQDGSGLAYFNARYYDPAAGQFTSADSVQGPNRYAYVAGNPETATDPTGQFLICGGMPMADGYCPIGIGIHQRGSGSGTTTTTTPTGSGTPTGTPTGSGHQPTGTCTSHCHPKPVKCNKLCQANSGGGDGGYSGSGLTDLQFIEDSLQGIVPEEDIFMMVSLLQAIDPVLEDFGLIPTGCSFTGCGTGGLACLHTAPCKDPTDVVRFSNSDLTNEIFILSLDRDIIGGIAGVGGIALAGAWGAAAIAAAITAAIGPDALPAVPALVAAIGTFITTYTVAIGAVTAAAGAVVGVMTVVTIDPLQSVLNNMPANSYVYTSATVFAFPTFYQSSEVSCPASDPGFCK
jgi:RHS repeat-associated protein